MTEIPLKPIVIYKEGLQEIIKYLGDKGRKVRFSINSYEYTDNVEELYSLSTKPKSLSLSIFDLGLSLYLSKSYAQISLDKDTEEALGTAKKLEEILKKYESVSKLILVKSGNISLGLFAVLAILDLRDRLHISSPLYLIVWGLLLLIAMLSFKTSYCSISLDSEKRWVKLSDKWKENYVDYGVNFLVSLISVVVGFILGRISSL